MSLDKSCASIGRVKKKRRLVSQAQLLGGFRAYIHSISSEKRKLGTLMTVYNV